MPLALLALLVTPASASPSSLAEVIAMSWKGIGEQPAEFTTSGKVVTEERLSMSLGWDGTSITGTRTSKFTLDYVTYTATGSVFGQYLPSEQAMSVTYSVPSGDTLPHGLQWCGVSGKLYFYNDAEHAGHFVLKGTMTSSCGATSSSIEYGTY